MAYTVTKLAKLSGISVRTLHHYDEIGLLKPAFYGSNGYRYYEEEQLLLLQQILFFKELGFELKQIGNILERDEFDKMKALISHRKVLEKQAVRMKKLIKTIDQTIEYLRGTTTMNEQEMFSGFSKEKQACYEKQLIETFGDKVQKTMAECRKNVQKWTRQDWERSHQKHEAICKMLAGLMQKNQKADSFETQEVIRQHYHWLKKFWTPTKETYAGLGCLYQEPEFRRKNYDRYHPVLADYLAKGMQVFAENEL